MEHKNKFLLQIIRHNLEWGVKEELYRSDIDVDILSKFRLESIMIPFNIDLYPPSRYKLVEVTKVIIEHFVFGIASMKGHKLILKYQQHRNKNAKNYETETKWKQIISIASALFIFISCIGLLGLVIISIEQRTKEIGIRKVLGAAVSRIVILISKQFVVLIAIAFVIAVPAGYYAIHKWLQDFAYRISIGWWMFALAGALVIIIALITLSYQAIKAAIANPVKSLRTE